MLSCLPNFLVALLDMHAKQISHKSAAREKVVWNIKNAKNQQSWQIYDRHIMNQYFSTNSARSTSSFIFFSSSLSLNGSYAAFMDTRANNLNWISPAMRGNALSLYTIQIVLAKWEKRQSFLFRSFVSVLSSLFSLFYSFWHSRFIITVCQPCKWHYDGKYDVYQFFLSLNFIFPFQDHAA